eukprot:gene6011-6709_t
MKPKCCNLSRRTSFISMMFLTSSFFLVEIVVGYVTNSMALVADSFHMLSDVASLLVGFLAFRYSLMGKRTHKYTFGYVRAEVLGALVNAVFLVALCFSITVESLKRIVVPEAVENALLVLFVGLAGLLVNVIGLFLFHQHGHAHSHGGGGHGHSHGGGAITNTTSLKAEAALLNEDLENGADKNDEDDDGSGVKDDEGQENDLEIVKSKIDVNSPLVIMDDEPGTYKTEISEKGEETLVLQRTKGKKKKKAPKQADQLNIRGVYLHVLGDALGSVIVIINALILQFQSGKWTHYVDPVMSVLMVMIILKTSIPLLKESSMILMQTVPTHLKIKEIQEKLVDQISGVLSVHEFHIWQLSGNKIIASAHVRCQNIHDYMAIANDLKEFFHNEGIHSTTIQPEFEEHSNDVQNGCILECAPEKNCAAQRCCGPATTEEKLSPRVIDGTAVDGPSDDGPAGENCGSMNSDVEIA